MNIRIKISRRWWFWGLFAVLMLTLFLRYVQMVYFTPMVFVAILALIAFLGDKDEIMAVCICCVPLSMTIQYYFILAFCMIVYFFKFGESVKLDFSFVPMLLIVAWELLHSFADNATLKEIMAMMIPYVVLIWIVSIRDIRSLDYSFIVRVFSALILWLCVLLAWRLFELSNYSLDIAFYNMQRLGLADEDVNGLVVNPNSLGILCVLAASGLCQIWIHRERRIGDIVLMIAVLALGALTISRTYLACLAIMAVYILLTSKDAKKKIRFVLGAVIIVLVVLLLLNWLFPSVLESFEQRFKVDDITSGRDALFMQFNKFLSSSFQVMLWGIGSMHLSDKVIYQYRIAPGVPHNGIQEILVVWGIPGLLFFIALVFVLLQNSKKVNPRRTAITYLPLLIIFAKMMVGQLVTSTYTMLALAFAYLSLCQDFSDTSDSPKGL